MGSFANSSRSLPAVDVIREVEILNGPASTLYGSDAIGGVISIMTWDPEDLVKLSDTNHFFKGRLGYDGRSSSHVISAMSAWQNDHSGALISFTRREGHELNNDAFVDGVMDELDWQQDAVFAKFTYQNDDQSQLTLSLDSRQQETQSNNHSLKGVGRQFASTTELLGDDQFDSQRLSFEYQYLSDTALFSVNTFRIHYMKGETTQRTEDYRRSRGTPVRQDRAFFFDQSIHSFEYNGLAEFSNHTLVAGLEYTQTDIDERRDGLQEDLLTGAITTSLLSERFPLRDFPRSKTTELGAFIQDEISLSSEWTIVPALRVDHFEMAPTVDALFIQNLSNPEVVSISETALSPKLGLLRTLEKGQSFFMQYVRGFRAPSYEDVNIGLEMPMFRIRAIPNPDLESETSDSIEFGYRQFADDSHLNLAAFYSRFDNFIESKVNLGPDATGFVLFQSQNINEAEIYGVELNHRVQFSLANLAGSSLTLDTRLAYTKGNNRLTNEPLNSISPAQAVFNLGWLSAEQVLGINLIAIATRAKSEVDQTNTDFFLPSGYTSLDLLVNYQITENTDIRFGIYNLGNREYWHWQDVRNLANDPQLIQSVVRPERSVKVSFSFQW
jgi:hemoglobin/transferrin/lactoferrin receptor protein